MSELEEPISELQEKKIANEAEIAGERKSANTRKKLNKEVNTSPNKDKKKISNKSILSKIFSILKLDILSKSESNSAESKVRSRKRRSNLPELNHRNDDKIPIDRPKRGRKPKYDKEDDKSGTVGTIVAMLMELAPYVVGIFEKVKSSLDSVSNYIDSNIVTPIKGAFTDLSNWVSGISDEIGSFITSTQTAISGVFSDIRSFFIKLFNDIADSSVGKVFGLDKIQDSAPTQTNSEVKSSDLSDEEIVNSITPTNANQNESATKAVHNMAKVALDNTDNASLGGGKYAKDGSKHPNISESRCARHTIDAINSQLPTADQILMADARDFFRDPTRLAKAGFAPIDKNEPHKVGDVIVEDGTSEHKWGHIQIKIPPTKGKDKSGRDSTFNYASDFLQKSTKVHAEGEGPKQAWRYVGKGNNTNSEGLGGGSEISDDNGDPGVVTNNTNNYYNTHNDTEQFTYVEYSNSIESQR